ncbi:hypothetical protein [Ruminococcus callidus]|jgi:hypothetical protein|uniref:hypothetical protein n=1 Tax=Ruminococcus callidus TaxID=40519 RepID=UPI002587A41F|nr:hypothetical protein [uncultured Ruminococcus sp.]
MAQFSQQEQNAMRREAARRAREMQKRVYFGKQQEPSPYADYPPEEPPQKKTPPPQTGMPLLGNLAQFRPTGLLSGLDGDTMLILAMMVMLYKDGGWDGCDKKLLMALAYLLT